jgi:hypothetical protein
MKGERFLYALPLVALSVVALIMVLGLSGCA